MAKNKIMTERSLRRKNIFKIVRTILEIGLVLAAIGWIVFKLTFDKRTEYKVISDPAYITASDMGLTPDAAAGASWLQPGQERFVCISYNGVSESEALESKLVSRKEFEAQLDALKASGYVTIRQQDILDAYREGKPLPEKSMLLLFEDGIYSTANICQRAMERNNYIGTICSYAQNLGDSEGRYVTTGNIRELLDSSYWELGSNGYRLSYINVFDRYDNYFGQLNLDEFLAVDEYLKRDYNHYLMDFIRSEDRLRMETVEEMEARIAYDYNQMHEIYTTELGFVPSAYVLMHANTDMFGNDPLVSDKNAQMIAQVFGMNFNRQGSCLNTTGSSVYDLTRLQSRPYFTTNHLMMRVWDDTGDNVAFLVGDVEEAENWIIDEGVAEFAEGSKIYLTSMPHGVGRMTLRSEPLSDVDMTVTLQGNVIGRQSILLRSDREGKAGIEVALVDNNLLVRKPGETEEALFRLDLSVFDETPEVSKAQNELDGKIALQKAIQEFDKDEHRVLDAQAELAKLSAQTAPGITDEDSIYVPTLDINMRDRRDLRIRLLGSRLSVWLNETLVVDNLVVDAGKAGAVVLEAEVSDDNDRFSQANLADDVYDAAFLDPIIRDARDDTQIIHAYTWGSVRRTHTWLGKMIDRILQFSIDTF